MAIGKANSTEQGLAGKSQGATPEFITYREANFSAGIDQQSPENRIPDGYVSDAINADPISSGQMRKRVGYQGYAGDIPLRVESLTYNTAATNNILLTFDSSVILPPGQQSPLIIFGRTSTLGNPSSLGDFGTATDTAKYYATYRPNLTRAFATGTTTLTITQAEHGFTTSHLFVNMALAPSSSSLDNSQIIPHLVEINKTTLDISITLINSSGAPVSIYIFIANKSTVPGQTYDSTQAVGTGTITKSFPAAIHSLNTFHITARTFEDTGTIIRELIPHSVVLNPSTGNVDVTLINSTGSSMNVLFILTDVPVLNETTSTISAGATKIITFSAASPGTSTPLVTAYLENGGNLEQVIPHLIEYSSTTQLVSVTVMNNQSTTAGIHLYWEFVQPATNTLSLSGAVIGVGFTDSQPQLTVYGFLQSEIYGVTRDDRDGWVTEIDSYRAAGEERLIAGLGGNFFAARRADEGVNFQTYLMPTLYPSLRGRMNGASHVGQAFWNTGETVARDRGYISADNSAEGYLEISAITYNVGTGWVDYTLSGTNIVANGTLSTIISSTTNLEDWLTTSQCGHSIHEGTFQVKAVSLPSATTLIISVLNTSTDPRLLQSNETDVGGLAGIFTDRLVLDSTSYFLSGDLVSSEDFTASDILNVTSSTGSSVMVNGLMGQFTLPVGLRITGSRISSVIPLRTLDGTTSVSNLVRGDMLSYSGISRQLRVRSLNVGVDMTIQSVTGDGTTATLTLGSGDNTAFFIGKKLLLQNSSAGGYNGVVTITALVGTTQLQFDSSVVSTETVTIVGNTMEVDEELSWSDHPNSANLFSVVSRWISLELPQSSFNLVPKTKPRYFNADPFSNMNITRSTMVQNNLYLNDYSNESMKIDGDNIYRTGLFRWQSQLFAAMSTAAAGKIVMSNPTVAVGSVAGNQFVVAAGAQVKFTVGDIIRHDNDNAEYTVKDTSVSTFITVDRTISGTGGNIIRTSTFKYYFRMNAVDSNNNVLASAVTGSGDFSIRLAADSNVSLRLVGMPAMDIYDYATLEVQIYRTKADGEIFYLLTTLSQSFNYQDGYLNYVDTASDSDLFDLDNVTQALVGPNRLGTGWESPLRAKYCSSANNRLILGNIRDYPTLDLKFVKNSGILTQSIFTTASNRKYLFRRDDTDTATVTNMVDRFTTEFVPTSSAVVIVPANIVNNTNTSFTVPSVAHGLAVDNWVYLYQSAVTNAKSLQYTGWFQIASATADTFTINHTQPTGYAPSAVDVDRYITATIPTDIPVLIGTDGNRGMLSGNRGTTLPYEFLAALRMGEAINATQRKVDTSLAGQSTYVPWITAGAGNDFDLGQIVLRQPTLQHVTPSLTLPALSGDFDIYINDIRRTTASSSSAVTKIFPSRIVMSYINFPEIFDRPTTSDETSSDSVIDINSSDGQEITGIIPFFGEAAFGAAQNSSILLVFKTNSIYLVDLNAKALGNGSPVIQKIDSFGQGCTAPYSIASTRNGIMFANESGLYRMNRSMDLEYIGRFYERKWQGQINSSLIGLVMGTHDSFAHSYKASYPIGQDTSNSLVAVYNHTKEYEAIYTPNYGARISGAWSTYDNHSATGWANLGNDSFFGNADGRVMIIRRTGEKYDYRDDSSAINMTWTTRAMDMGDSGRRKLYSRIVTHYRNPAGVASGTTLGVSMNTKGVFQATDTFTLRHPANPDNLSDMGSQTIFPVISTIQEKTGVFIQCQYINGVIDEAVEITGIDFRVAPMAIYGISEASQLK